MKEISDLKAKLKNCKETRTPFPIPSLQPGNQDNEIKKLIQEKEDIILKNQGLKNELAQSVKEKSDLQETLKEALEESSDDDEVNKLNEEIRVKDSEIRDLVNKLASCKTNLGVCNSTLEGLNKQISELKVSLSEKETLSKKEKDDANSCLLYTSPSPRDLSTSRMPSSA